MDFTKLRAAAMKDGDDEEAVTVNTRALIDKVLARYSGEWTTLRELIQNAADAQATTVSIKFETLPSAQVPLSNTTNNSEILKHVLLNHTLRRLVVTNNGQSFGVNDWARLKRIAEGNPDETKIGAFGVGFYSVFADCEDPFVSSGPEAMAFYWKGNSLFTKKLQLPPAEANPNTSFVLDYRNTTTPMPNLLSIAQFLATSLTFVSLENIELWVDDWRILSLTKKVAPSVDIPLVKDVETKTKEGLMSVQSLDKESVQMDATFMNVVGWKPSIPSSVSKPGNFEGSYGTSNSDVPSLRSFFSRLTTTKESRVKMEAVKEEKAMQEIVLEDLTALTTTNVFLRVTTARVKTSVSAQFASELERATKKPPPKTTKIAILTSSYDEAVASTKQNKVAKGVDVFSSVLPSKKPGGRIFIGFPTHQTTGAGLHLSAPSVIPTVERESIDLNARWVRTWNIEMLRVAGIMSRLAFANEMADLSAKVKQTAEAAGRGTRIAKEDVDKLMPEALHILKTFTFSDSTPAPMVSRIIEEAFWTAYKKPSIEMYSSKGVLLTTQVRLAVEDLSGFVDGIPVVPDELKDITFVNKLKDFGVITEVTFSDVKKELEAKALNQDQLVQFIGWAGRKAVQGEMDAPTINQLLDVTIATVGENEGQGGIITLGTIKNFLLPSKIPADDSLPLPPSTIPYQFTRASKINELQALGWDTLEIVPWLRFLIESAPGAPEGHNLTKSPKFAAQVLLIISKQWEVLSAQGQNTVISLLKPITIIPTKFGMKRPNEAFFASVKLFDDLPIVTGCPHIKEKFFAAIGVRKTVDLETIFKRLLPAEGSEKGEIGINKRNGHMEIIKYLASVADEIPSGDMVRLRGSKICPAEAGPKGMESAKGTAELYPVNELFAPNSALRDLGLPILQWAGPPGSFRAASVEGRFLNLLGLRSFPSVPELINLMASDDELVRHKAMTYYIANHHINQYDSFNVGAARKAFLPIVGDSNRLVTPAECFTNEACAILGFNILKRDLHVHGSKFGVAKDPPIANCVQVLISKPPPTRREAVTLFNYFASRLGEVGPHSVVQLSDAKIVPVLPKNSKNLKYLAPRQCYIGNSPTYGEIFDFVDFGTDANLFLTKCGSKNEPSNLEIAAEVARSPARIYDIVGSTDKYLSLLRTLADDLSTLKRDKQLFTQMKSSQFLLAWQEVAAAKKKQSSKDNEFDEEEPRIKTYRLAVPSDIVVSDEYNSFRLFSQSLICAPEEEKLERFYLALGSRTVSSLVEQDLRIGSFSEKQQPAAMLQKQILERSKLFLHDVDPSTIRYDSRWLEKNFSVAVVSSISLRRSLRGTSLQHKENRTAAYKQDRTRGHILYITGTGIDTYQVGQSMCNLLLTRPTQQAMLTFESLLTLNLYQLRSRGYNVDRILRAKAAEQRVAEEERKKQLEQEQQRIQQQEEEWKKQGQMVQAAAKEDNRKSKSMPGAFGSDSPPQSPAPKRGRGLFSGLKERFGLDSGSMGEAQEQLQNFLGGGKNDTPPPPYEDGAKNQKRKETEKVSSPHAVQQNLLNAIQSSRAHDSSGLFSPPSQQIIKEASEGSYCDSTPSQNITFLADASNGTRVFISKTAATPANTFLSENVTALNSFAALLHEVGSVYGITPKALHIFYDESGSTIAFNSSGSIFCNYRFFNQLHRAKLESEGDTSREGKTEAASYWWIVMAHELSHNLIKEHNAEHSFYTEMLVANYFPKMMAMANRFTAGPSRTSRQIQSESAVIGSGSGSKNGEAKSLLD